jgi:cytochrome c-type biogenesis protein CcmH/NrfG
VRRKKFPEAMQILAPFRACFAVLATVVTFGILFPHARTWGFHFLAYYSFESRLVLAGAAALLALLSLWPSWLAAMAARIRQVQPHPLLFDAIFALLCGVAFYVFASAVPLLGDGQLWIDELSNPDPNIWSRRGPLTMFALDQLHHALRPLIGMDLPGVFRLTSALSGVVAVLAWLRFARAAGVGPLLALLWGFAWGGTALFFGYVELYVIMAGVLSAMLALMLISLRRGEFFLWVPLLALLAAALNYIALTFWPAVAAYVVWGVTKRPLKTKSVFFTAGGLMAVAAGAYFVTGWYRGTSILLPLWPAGLSASGYVLQPRHLVDLANGLVLACGPFLVLLCGWFVTRRDRREWSGERLILALALVFPLAAYIMHNSHLGMARDWDIGCALLLAVPFASLLLWSEWQPSPRERAAALPLVAAWLMLMTIPWIGVQASDARAMSRFTHLLRLDPERSASGWDYLGAFYRLRDKPDQWVRCYREALKYSDNPRYHYNLAVYHIFQREWDKAEEQILQVRNAVFADSVVSDWEIRIIDTRQLLEMGRAYENLSGMEDARMVYWLASQLDPNSPLPPMAIAEMVVRSRDLIRAEEMFRMIFAKDSVQEAEAKGYYVSLVQAISSTLQIEAFCGLAVLTRIAGDMPQARENASRALTLTHGDDRIAAYLAAFAP